jgi:hypothetical protein
VLKLKDSKRDLERSLTSRRNPFLKLEINFLIPI